MPGADSSVSRVYPRVCGGNLDIAVRDLMVQGLSPRVRGEPDGIASEIIDMGSIPACAGGTLGVLIVTHATLFAKGIMPRP